MRQALALLAFNRGLVSVLGMARADLKRLAMSAEVMTNWMCRVLGSMMLRPGTKFIGDPYADAATKLLPFIFSASDKAMLEMTNLIMRVWISDALLTRPAVTTAVAGGTFPSAASLAANWSDNDEAGCTSAWVAAAQVGFTGTGTLAAIRRQTVAVVESGTEHALRVIVSRGPLTIRVGSSSGADDYISETALGTGTHSLAFTPGAGSIYIEFNSRLERVVYLAECRIEVAGVVTLPTPWLTANLGNLRNDQSGDIVYVACNGYQQRKIERRGTGRSWSVVLYEPLDGPFRTANTGTLTLTPNAIFGNGTLTASRALFKSTHLGALFAVTSTGQTAAKSMVALNDATPSIQVTGVGTDRTVTINLAGLSGTGNTVVLERAFDNATWIAVGAPYSWVADAVGAYIDGLDNQIVYYRLRCSVYAAGATSATISIPTGSVRGVCRLTAITSSVLASMEVLSNFGTTGASSDWEEGAWSDYRGWPTAVRFYEGRLYWPGKDRIVGSISDGFESFDPEVVGDSGVINRSIGSGQVDTINFVLALQRLILGGQGAEHSCRSTAFDEPLTPTNFNIKKASRQGSSSMVDGVEIDNKGIYVQRGGIRVFELSFSTEAYASDYASTQLSQLVPNIGYPGIVRIGVQRQPDTRVHFVRSDGTVAVLVFDSVENVICWLNVTSPAAGGLVEDVLVLPCDEGEQEDHVYYVVKRTIMGATVRYIERWATEAEAKGDQQLCFLADSAVSYTGALTNTVSAVHLAGQNVAIWADGKDVGTTDGSDGTVTYTYTLDASGNATLPETVTNYVVGLPYTAQWQSAKLVQIQSQLGTSLIDMEIIDGLAVIARDMHPLALRFGADFDHLDNMPSIEEGAPVLPDDVHAEYDGDPFPFPGKWSNDARLCLQAQSPRPVTALAIMCIVKAND